MFCVLTLVQSCIDFVLFSTFQCILFKIYAISILLKCFINTEEGGFDQSHSISLLKVNNYP